MPFRFDNSYVQLSEEIYTNVNPTFVSNPQVVVFNTALATSLGLGEVNLSKLNLGAYFSGNLLFEGAQPIAQAYAGHQFGQFNKLGDGRAILLGEHIAPIGERFDVQLKGAGATPYSRRGDGKATLSSMLREYLISEAMYCLGIPTTRSLAVVSTGEKIYRETITPSAVLTRIAASHIRVGTFEYVRNFHSEAILKQFTDYTIQRHYPALLNDENPALALLNQVLTQQIELIIHWLRVGFIHGVMNTDNMSIACETIDYGPCAFMNTYNPHTVFSSIDHQGRYAFANQPNIALWNLTRFAESLLPLIDGKPEIAIEKANEVLQNFQPVFESQWLQMMGHKLGILDVKEADNILISTLLEWMFVNKADYTNTFIELSVPTFNTSSMYQEAPFLNWVKDWKTRIQAETELPLASKILMQKSNPAFIPRNHLVEIALHEAQENNDITAFNQLLAVLANPYDYTEVNHPYQTPTLGDEGNYKTFCGT
jgi:uncharacterized protein YdiU (UPF0061 family)